MTDEQNYLMEVNGIKVYAEIEPGIYQIENDKFVTYQKYESMLSSISFGTIAFCDTIEQARELVNKEDEND